MNMDGNLVSLRERPGFRNFLWTVETKSHGNTYDFSGGGSTEDGPSTAGENRFLLSRSVMMARRCTCAVLHDVQNAVDKLFFELFGRK